MKKADSLWRSAVKAATWRFLASTDTLLLGWLFTRSLKAAGAIALTEVATKFAIYFAHERLWQRIPLGKRKEA